MGSSGINWSDRLLRHEQGNMEQGIRIPTGRLGTCVRFPQRPCVSRRPPGNLAKSTHGIMEIGPRIFFSIVCCKVLSTMLYMIILSCMCYISAVIKTQYLVKGYHTCLLDILQFFLPNKPV